MTKNIKQLPKEIDKLIDLYIPYETIVSIPVKAHFLHHYLYIEGIYFLCSRKKIVYIGCSSNIGARLKNHLFGGDCKKNITKIGIIRYRIEINTIAIEAKLIDKFKPKYNKVYPYGYPIPTSFNLIEITEQIKQKLAIN